MMKRKKDLSWDGGHNFTSYKYLMNNDEAQFLMMSELEKSTFQNFTVCLLYCDMIMRL